MAETVRKLIVEVVDAHNLMPKDGAGTSSPYVTVDFDGQRKRTKTKHKELNPVWNEKLEFVVSDPKVMAAEELEAEVYNDKRTGSGGRSHFLGRIRIDGSQFVKKGEEALIYFPLKKRNFYNYIKGELGLRIYYADEPKEPPAEEKPPEPPAEAPPAEDAPPTEQPPADAPSTTGAPVEGTPAEEPKLAESPATEAPPTDAAPAETPTTEGEQPPEEAAPPPSAETPPPAEEAKPPPDEQTAGDDSKPEASVAPPPVMPFIYQASDSAPGMYESSAYDLVEKMQYLFVRIVKARGLAPRDPITGAPADPYVNIRVGSELVKTRTSQKSGYPDWNQIFAFGKNKLQSAPTLEISVWDDDTGSRDDFLGGVCFDLSEVPLRVPPDSPLAPQWYRLEGEGRVKGDIMLAVWIGTQADEAFPEAWQSDAGGIIHTRAKVYLSPKLWYLRVNVIEAQDLLLPVRYPDLRVRVQLGFQVLRTRAASNGSNRISSTPLWNEDLVFVAAEPFEEQLVLIIEERSNKEPELVGHARVPLTMIERRVDERLVSSRWFDLDKSHAETDRYRGRIHLRLCFDGGYHVMDEAAHLSSDMRPTAKQLWKPPLGVLELGILGAQNLLPMKTKVGRGSTDAYCVAKYGQKWVRTRTIPDNFSPKWNEQYTWQVYDPCTVLTLGVFDNWHIFNLVDEKTARPDYRIGKVRIRISTLESNKVYTNSYPLMVLGSSGVKKMGEIELAVRFTCNSLLDVLHVYSQPMLPKMHYLHPMGLQQQDMLRNTAMKIVALRLSRSEPPLRQEVVQYMLDTDSNMWSMRRSKANWFRIMNVLSGVMNVAKWIDDICQWKNPVTTVLVHLLFLILVWYPELIVPTVFFYIFLIGCWYYRFRPRMPSHMDIRLSHADAVDEDELDEEFDPIPSKKPPEVVRTRYDRLRCLAARIQMVLGDFATQGERIQALLSWRDPRATGIFIAMCFIISLILYIVHFKMVAVLLGFYFLRHPRFREPMPPSSLNFFRRLPSLADRIL